MATEKTEYYIKMFMNGNFPSGIETDTYKIDEQTYDEIQKLLNSKEYIIGKKGYIII